MKLVIAAWALLISPYLLADVLADRLLFEVDLQSYSQSQMELYLVCKDVLSGSDKVREISPGNWDRLLEEFKNDMVIHQEAVRLGSFEASARVLEKALDVFQDHRSGNEIIRQRLEQLGVDDQAIRRTVSIAVRVEGFRRSKKRQTAVLKNRAETSLVRRNTTPEWQEELTQRAVIRFYEGAIIYKAIKLNL